jgi:hypothetical protein
MNADDRLRLQQHSYPRPPEDVIDEAVLRGFRKPEDQDWLRSPVLHLNEPPTFRCGFHSGLVDYGPVLVADLEGLDGKVYRRGAVFPLRADILGYEGGAVGARLAVATLMVREIREDRSKCSSASTTEVR